MEKSPMNTDSILNVPLGHGMYMERTITSDGDVEIKITGADDQEVYSEEILRVVEGDDGHDDVALNTDDHLV